MVSSKEILNKVNLITLSRIVLSIIGVMFLFTGNIQLLIIAFAIMGFSEVSDVIDGYVARRDKLVTNFGKILDPLSDSISRFFYFFAFAYHGLFPIWFMIFFFFRDIVVAYVRIYASFSGTVMSARISGKVKGAFQFAGQYLLMIALMINTYQETTIKPDYSFFLNTAVIGLVFYILMLFYFRIKGGLLILVGSLAAVLAGLLLLIPSIPFQVNYLTTFTITFLTLTVTLYSLVDYICSLDNRVKELPRYLITFGLVVFMFFISPYFLDGVKNKIENKSEMFEFKTVNDNVLNSPISAKKLFDFELLLTSGKLQVFNGQKILESIDLDYGATSQFEFSVLNNKVFILNKNKSTISLFEFIHDSEKVELVSQKKYNLGLLFGARAMTAVFYNENNYLVFQDNYGSRRLFFVKVDEFEEDRKLIRNYDFAVQTEFYIKDIFAEGNNLYALAGKIGDDLIYEINIHKLITSGDITKSISKIWSVPGICATGLVKKEYEFLLYDSVEKRIVKGEM